MQSQIFLTSVIDPEPVINSIESQLSDLQGYSALIVAVVAMALFIRKIV